MNTPRILVVNKTKAGINLYANGQRVTSDTESAALREMVQEGKLKLVKDSHLSQVYRPTQGQAKPKATNNKSFTQCLMDNEPVVIDGATIWKDTQGSYYKQVGKSYTPISVDTIKAWVAALPKAQPEPVQGTFVPTCTF